MNSRKLARRLLTALSASACLVLFACGDDGLGKRYSVYGNITYKGEPVKKGAISFVPEAPEGRAASGSIENGYYTLATLNPGDGAFPGKYKVTVTSKEVDMSEAQAKVKGMGGSVALPQDFVAKANRVAKNNIPAKYSTPSTTTLSAEVLEKSNKFDFELVD